MKDEMPHWSPVSAEAQQDQLTTYDEMRRRCPVAYSDALSYSILGHAELKAVVEDYHTYSNKAGRYVSIPNGIDPPQHTVYRQVIERYFTFEAMAAFAPICQQVSGNILSTLPGAAVVEVMREFARPFAQKIQCAFMGWPDELQEPLREWVKHNQQAIAAQDRPRLAELALAFDGYIRSELEKRRRPDYQEAVHDNTLRLMGERTTIDEQLRLLTDDELVSIIRNWTVGELGSISACVGIICWYLGENVDLQNSLRQHPEKISDALDEILRIHPPLIANRRKATKATTVGGVSLPEDAQVTILWAAANRDEKVFGADNDFDPDRNKANNLLYGLGIHECPGAPLARLELNTLFEKLLNVKQWRLTATRPSNAAYPAGGFEAVYIDVFDR